LLRRAAASSACSRSAPPATSPKPLEITWAKRTRPAIDAMTSSTWCAATATYA
jgi:hypothetical protein